MGVWTPYALAPTRPRDHAVVRLAARLRRVGLEGVLADLDRSAEECRVPGEAAGDGFTWDAADRTDPAWWPQGVASIRSGDVLLVSWYARRRRFVRTPGARISVVDRRHPDGPRYRHVLLVSPRRPLALLGMRTVPVHAGGIAVRDDLLYVADTLFGVRLFRLRDVLRAERPSPGRWGAIRLLRRARPTGGVRGHDYVLPQSMALRVPLRSGLRRLRHSFLSIGEVAGRPNLVVGEYRRKGGNPRLARYPLDPGTGLPVARGNGVAPPLEVHDGQPDRMQGAAVHGSTWFVTASAGEGVAGDLYVGAPGSWRRHRRVLPPGPEDLAWSRPGEELWCASEWPGRRWVFPIATGRWQPPPGAGTAAGP
ncbi:hypothetical protein [Blastococcus deserti]|uniref:Sugar lactone lactonase YvrE n=1 Tax=Blastococcus deserti TaxID=2259033 RepID=A0ABW4XCQ6_9ACTN